MTSRSIIPAPLARLPWELLLLVILIGGFGMLARLGFRHGANFPLWLWVKLAVWVTAAAEPVIVRMANIQHLASPIRAQLRKPMGRRAAMRLTDSSSIRARMASAKPWSEMTRKGRPKKSRGSAGSGSVSPSPLCISATTR